MIDAINVLGRANAAGFGLIGLLAVVSWVRWRGRARACLAVALGLLGVVSVLGQVGQAVHLPVSVALGNLVAFVGSGYALFELRHQLLPVGPRVHLAALVAVVTTTALAVPLTLEGPHATPTPRAWVVGSVLILGWALCIGEPAVRFWFAAKGRPRVQRARLRLLSFAYLSLAVALVLAVAAAGGSAIAGSTTPSPVISLVVEVVVSLIMPLFYVGFEPPRWMRARWRIKEADPYREAMFELVASAPDLETMAGRGVDWAVRFVGGDGGALIGPNGEVLASRHLFCEAAAELSARVLEIAPTRPTMLDPSTAVAPTRIGDAHGWLVVTAGPFSLLFDGDELRTVAQFATSLSLALALTERLTEQTRRADALLAAVAELGAGLVVADQGRVVETNAAYARLTGYSHEELEGQPFLGLVPEDERAQATASLTAALNAGDAADRFETHLVRHDGTVVDVAVAADTLLYDQRERVVALVQDISAQKRGEAALAEAARRDPLTGLFNRGAWDEQLASALASAAERLEPICVAMLDLDGFKEFNDDWGHQRGDLLLQRVARTWSEALRDTDFLARYGGDEFAILMPCSTAPEATSALYRIFAATPEVASAGVAEWDGQESPAELVARADAALLRSKRDRRGGVTVAPAQTMGISSANWTARLDAILDRRTVAAAYQPIVDLRSGTVLGHEALLRPDGADAHASVEELFVAAQRLGSARDLDWLGRRTALEGARHLPPGRLLFVNVSPRALLDPVHGTDQMLMLLDSVGRSPDSVVLEISEREAIGNLPRLRAVLQDYRAHGFRFALDDVGEGHSTLEILAAADPEFIKIARTLVENLDTRGPSAAVRAIVTFANSNRARVIAEGISDRRMVEPVRALGVQYGQGFALGVPRSHEVEQRAS